MTARAAAAQSVAFGLVCLVSYSLARQASTYVHSLSNADDQLAGLWSVIATAFVFRSMHGETVSAAKMRVAATALSFALCFVYLLFLPSSAWGLAALIALGTFVLTWVGQPGDIGVGAITTSAVMVTAALGPHQPWRQPLIGAVGTAIGIVLGLAGASLAGRLRPRAKEGSGDADGTERVPQLSA